MFANTKQNVHTFLSKIKLAWYRFMVTSQLMMYKAKGTIVLWINMQKEYKNKILCKKVYKYLTRNMGLIVVNGMDRDKIMVILVAVLDRIMQEISDNAIFLTTLSTPGPRWCPIQLFFTLAHYPTCQTLLKGKLPTVVCLKGFNIFL